MDRHEAARQHASSPDGQVRADKPECADVDRDPGTLVVRVLDLETWTERVAVYDRLRERGEFEQRAHPGALPVHVDPARDRSDIERPDGVLDELEDPLVRDERIAVRDDGEHLAAIPADDGLALGNRRILVLVGLVDWAERHGEVDE